MVCWGCLNFLFQPFIATVRHSDIYRAIPTWVPRLPKLRFGDRRGARLLRMGWLVHSPLTMRIWVTRRQAGGQIGRSSVEWLATFWGIHGEFGTTLNVKPTFRTFVIFHGLVPRSCSSLSLLPSRSTLLKPAYPWTLLLKLDLQFGLQSLLIPYYFVVLLFGRALALL